MLKHLLRKLLPGGLLLAAAILLSDSAVAGPPTVSAATDFTQQALDLSGADDPGGIPGGFLEAVPEEGLVIDDSKRSATIFGGVIGAKVFGPAYSTPPAAWFISGSGEIVADRPAVAVSFRLFLQGLDDEDPDTNGEVTVEFQTRRGRTISSLTFTEERFVDNAQFVSFSSKIPFRRLEITTNGEVQRVSIDDLLVEMIGFGGKN